MDGPEAARGGGGGAGRRSRAGSQGGGSVGSMRRRDWRGSSSEDETPRMDPQLFASLLAQATAHQQYAGDLRTYRPECDEAGAPCAPRSPRSPQLRQSSPFPVESTNRRMHYAASQDRLRPNGEIIYATSNPKKLPSNSSLSRQGWGGGGRRSRALTPSSSASSGLEGIQASLQGNRPPDAYVLEDQRLATLCMTHGE